MRSQGTPEELARRRRLAVRRVLDGYSQQSVARFLGVHRLTVHRWLKACRQSGWSALRAKAVPGRPPKLTRRQARSVLGWLKRSPWHFGFATERWTAPRVARLIAERFRTVFHPRYVNQWLAQRGITPQVPAKVAQERDEATIQRWIAVEWPRIKKRPGG